MYSEKNLIDRLSKVAHFKGMPPRDLWEVVTSGKVRRFKKESILFTEGEPSSGLFVIFSGKVNLTKLTPAGQEYIISTIEPVIMFNEVAALDGGPNPVSAVAVQDVVVWNMRCEEFQNLLKRHPNVSLGLLKVLASRNRLLISRYEDLTCRTILARTARFLLVLSDNGEKPVNRREHPNRVLAARAATGPEQFSRSIKTLQDEGLIECNRSWIHVVDRERLARIALIGLEGA